MILNIDLTGKELVVTQNPEPKLDQEGKQRVDKKTGQPMWATQAVVTDESGGEIIRITTVGEQPDVRVGEELKVTGLVGIPWASNGRAGMAWRADSISALT